MSVINLLNFNVLIDDQQCVFFTKKTLIKTKYKCQWERKSRNSKVPPTKRVVTRPFCKLLTSFLVRACLYAKKFKTESLELIS